VRIAVKNITQNKDQFLGEGKQVRAWWRRVFHN